jgi:hypothetical protein
MVINVRDELIDARLSLGSAPQTTGGTRPGSLTTGNLDPLTRRNFVIGGVAAATPLLQACGTTFIPLIRERAFNLVLDVIEKVFVGRYFAPGEVMANRPMMDFSDYVADKILQSFRRAGGSRNYNSPIVLCTLGAGRYIQAQTDRRNGWSLVCGGESGEDAFMVHVKWLNWLFTEDTCSFRVNGSSYFGECGIDGCRLRVTRQDFLEVDGRKRTLSFEAEDPGMARDARTQWQQFHARHTTTWGGCVVPSERTKPDDCTNDRRGFGK